MTFDPTYYILNLDRPSRCIKTDNINCEDCAKEGEKTLHNPTEVVAAGCDLLEQNGFVYGWSESNGQYERIGSAKRKIRG
jgi:hypothetical protein